jgi:uncharacterized glyoxalase superfamily protein PhnB
MRCCAQAAEQSSSSQKGPTKLHGPHAGRGWIYVAVTDADAHYRQAAAAGASVHGEPHDFGDGFRGYSATDLEGNLWTFGTAQP